MGAKPKVYLAGPITGLSYDDAVGWRKYVKQQLEPTVVGYSPLRSKSYLSKQTSIKDTHDYNPLSSQRGIYTRDLYDCRTCDLMFVNMLGALKVSIGTSMEIAWAAAFNKPIVLVIEDLHNVHDHAMIREACSFIVDNIDDGIFLTKSILLA